MGLPLLMAPGPRGGGSAPPVPVTRGPWGLDLKTGWIGTFAAGPIPRWASSLGALWDGGGEIPDSWGEVSAVPGMMRTLEKK